MTETNAIRHALSKGKKAKTYEQKKKIWAEFCNYYYSDMCDCCTEDDFGYCGLRKEKIPDQCKFVQYCFPSFLKYLESEIEGLKR